MLHLDAGQLASRLPRGKLIDALDDAFRRNTEVPPRQHHVFGQQGADASSLLVMPAWRDASLGVKLVTVVPQNAARGESAVHATYTLFDARTGVPRATMDGAELTHRRTGAASALAARYLATPDSSRLLMVGTGGLAMHVIESHATVRPLREVRIWGRNTGRARDLAARLGGGRSAYFVEATEDLEGAVRWADIISCATLASSPLIHGAWLRAGQHLDLIGAFRPDMREADQDALLLADIYVDTREGALRESGELVQAIAAGALTSADIRGELADLARGVVAGRTNARQITLFKSVGTAIEDLAAAELALS
jgi:ornithine cyclodeaminase/alanine dehydrogenase-like protein (mu-crystallin family)